MFRSNFFFVHSLFTYPTLDTSRNLIRQGVQPCEKRHKSDVISFSYYNHVRKIFSLFQTLNHRKKNKSKL